MLKRILTIVFLVLISTHSYSLTKNEEDFFQAARDDDIVTFKKLLDAGIDINLQNRDYGYTSLILATLNGRTGIAKEIINNGADINLQDECGFTALMYATQYSHTDLSYTAEYYYTDIAKELINKGAKINIQDKEGLYRSNVCCNEWSYRNS
ncbi:ankyrin repeat domain-containing protein [Helicobacter sp.]|uniref:ankyrin repeat domain-containing protein n=1 Tax=Helicobacter sp. TaxID=218 RepID=UPI0019C2F213|nr:ankyrin repeat domain-containing protein [Helicobacter sp.]MBD5164386.1 ankyrin repeat domain-containing protein [Helicobacter sp.]